ncbi:MAG: hypothetical protein Ct9H300mP11_10480 [Chloroflexota bacterium]|nr:MAG: hypothetical protein Ct9H300mP11_10480 [Chloroflexota bacterium]
MAVWSGNDALAMGAAAAGCKFYAAYPMSPASGVLHWMAANARNLGIMVRQVEDEMGVAKWWLVRHKLVPARCAQPQAVDLLDDGGSGRRGDEGNFRWCSLT